MLSLLLVLVMMILPSSYAGYATINLFIGSDGCNGNIVSQQGIITNKCLMYPVGDGYTSVYTTCNNVNSISIAYQYSNCTGKSVSSFIPNGICTKAGAIPTGDRTGPDLIGLTSRAKINQGSVEYYNYLGICQTGSTPIYMSSAAFIEKTYIGASTQCQSTVDIFQSVVLNSCFEGLEVTCSNNVAKSQQYNSSTCQGTANITKDISLLCNQTGIIAINTICTAASPTPSPTIAITTLNVNMELANFPYSSYVLNKMLYVDTIIQSIVNSTNAQLLSLGTSESISGQNVDDLVISNSTSSRKLSTTTQVSYQISSSVLSQSSLSTAVVSTYTTGTFNNALHYYAQTNGAIGLEAVTLASSPNVNNVSPTPSSTTSTHSVNTAAIAGAVVGTVVFLLFMMLGYILMRKNKIFKTVLITKTETTTETTNPIAHRISQTESTLKSHA